MSIEFALACELAKKIRDKSIGSRELADSYLEGIEGLDADLDDVVVRDFEGARAAASSRLPDIDGIPGGDWERLSTGLGDDSRSTSLCIMSLLGPALRLPIFCRLLLSSPLGCSPPYAFSGNGGSMSSRFAGQCGLLSVGRLAAIPAVRGCHALSLVALVLLVVGGGCNHGSSSSSGIGQPELNLLPGPTARTLEDLQGNAAVDHPPDELPTFVWSWECTCPSGATPPCSCPGNTALLTEGLVDSTETTKNETWTVTVFADLGSSLVSSAETAEVVIVNTPPAVDPEIVPEAGMGLCVNQATGSPGNNLQVCSRSGPPDCPRLGRPLCAPRAPSMLTSVLEISDDDDDPTTIEGLQWLVNGVPVATTRTLDSSFFEEGDDLELTVAVSDGETVSTGTTGVVKVQPAL